MYNFEITRINIIKNKLFVKKQKTKLIYHDILTSKITNYLLQKILKEQKQK